MNPEVQHCLERIENIRQQVIDLTRDLPPESLNWRPIASSQDHATNSLAVLASHIAGAEHFWIAEVVGGYDPTRQRNEEFATEASASHQLVDLLVNAGVETKQVMSNLTPSMLNENREVRGRVVPVRWAILHVIDHSSLHLGHMQLTYQLWMGGQSPEGPRWFQRLPE
jgi:uncharacterized damage-inducible protein DinB